MTKATVIYPDADNAALMKDAKAHLLNFGTTYYPEVIVHASGVYVYTASGQRLLDWTSGQMSCLLGHGDERIVSVIRNHAASLDHVFSGMLTPPVIGLAKKLTGLLPEGLDRAFFLSTGGESNEAAIKLAKVVTGKYEIIGLSASWHGVTSSAAGAQYTTGRKHIGPLIPGQLMLPAPNAYRSIFRRSDGSHDWQAELDYGFSMVDIMSAGSLAAVIVEPILSSGGILTLPQGYLKALKQHCERRGMMLIVDEAQTALGRAGDMFAFEHDGINNPDDAVVPDILTLSKTLGNGLPLSAVVTSHEIANQAEAKGYMFYTTHVNDPLPAAVGLEVLNIVQRDGLVEHARVLGVKLQAGLRRLQARYRCIGDVRGRGLLAGLEIVRDRGDDETKETNGSSNGVAAGVEAITTSVTSIAKINKNKEAAPELGNRISQRMSELGIWSQLIPMKDLGSLMRIAPPVTITESELMAGLAVLEQAFADTDGTRPLY